MRRLRHVRAFDIGFRVANQRFGEVAEFHPNRHPIKKSLSGFFRMRIFKYPKANLSLAYKVNQASSGSKKEMSAGS